MMQEARAGVIAFRLRGLTGIDLSWSKHFICYGLICINSDCNGGSGGTGTNGD